MTHSFPTRRSSDIRDEPVADLAHGLVVDHADADVIRHCGKFLNARHACGRCVAEWYQGVGFARPNNGWIRSEEHTSELQSLMRISYAVICMQKKQNEKEHEILNGRNKVSTK